MRSELVEPRLVKVRAGARGSGWAVGARGVLTARHVVNPFLTSQVPHCVAVPSPAPGAAQYHCTVIWQDQQRDLALLAVEDSQTAAWTAAVGPGPGPALAEPGTAGLSVEAVGYPTATVEEDFPHPELALGWLKPAGGAVSGRMPLDVDGAVPDDSLLWQGISGAGVRDRRDGRLLGVVVTVDADYQQRRLYVAVLPDPVTDPAFAAALKQVGARPVLEAVNARRVQQLLEVSDAAGRLPIVGQVTDLKGVFGVREARTDIDTQGNPYFPYVRRDLDGEIDAALDRRVGGDEGRMLLLVGKAMTGKSRTLAHAIQIHPVVGGWPLLVPQHSANLQEVTELAPETRRVLWLGDLNTYAAGLSPGVVRYWQTRPGLMVVATLRAELLHSLREDPKLAPAWNVVDDPTLVEQLHLPVDWSSTEIRALTGADPLIRTKVDEGIPLGEVLGAAEELRDRLATADTVQKAVALTVIDWARTGLTEGMAEASLEELYPAYLSRRDVAALSDDAVERHQTFTMTLAEILKPIPHTASRLITRDIERQLRAEDYLVAQWQQAQEPIPHPVWKAALTAAQEAEGPTVVSSIGYNAAIAGVDDIARAAWTPVANSDSEDAPAAARNLGVLLARMGDPHGARAAYQRAIDSQHPEQAPAAAVGLGMLLAEQGDAPGARAAYQLAIDSQHQDAAPRAAFNLGMLLEGQGDAPGARAAYQLAIDSQHQDAAPRAAVGLGMLLAEQGDVAGARAAYQLAIDSQHPEQAPAAAVGLGVLLAEQGDAAGARAAYQLAIDSQHPEQAPWAELLMAEGDPDPDARRRRRERVATAGNVDVLVSLAALYAVEGELETAGRLLNQASRNGHASAQDYSALLDEVPPAASCVESLMRLAAAGDTDSMNFLGVHALRGGDEGGTRDWWTRSAASGDIIAPLLLRHLRPRT